MDNTLLENFYEEKSSTYSTENNSKFVSIIELNPDHEVYKGHFEQTPVAPGVCLIQIVKEILMNKLNTNLFLSEGKNIKFLGIINPTIVKDFQLDFNVSQEGSVINVSVNYINDGRVYTKLKLTFHEKK